MRCKRFNVYGIAMDKLPLYIEHGGAYIPRKKADILIRVDAIPEPGKTIIQSHGEMIDGKWTEVIDDEKTSEEIKQARVSFNIRDILNACASIDIPNGDDVMMDKISTILANPVFAGHLSGTAGSVNLSDPVTVQAMEAFTDEEIAEIKTQI